MAADESGTPPESAGPGRIFGMPWWVLAAGAGGLALFLWYRNRQNAGTGAVSTGLQGLTTQTAGGGVDPNTGLPIDPFTGSPYITSAAGNPSGTLSDWITKAEKALVEAGFAPGTVNQAIYDYTSGNPLNNTEAGVINRALALVGFPPVTLPFFGNVPKTTGQGTGTHTSTVYLTTNKLGPVRQFTPVNGQKLVDLLLKNGLIVRHPNGAGVAQYFTTKKFGGTPRLFDPNIPLTKVISVLIAQGIIKPAHVQVAA